MQRCQSFSGQPDQKVVKAAHASRPSCGLKWRLPIVLELESNYQLSPPLSWVLQVLVRNPLLNLNNQSYYCCLFPLNNIVVAHSRRHLEKDRRLPRHQDLVGRAVLLRRSFHIISFRAAWTLSQYRFSLTIASQALISCHIPSPSTFSFRHLTSFKIQRASHHNIKIFIP